MAYVKCNLSGLQDIAIYLSAFMNNAKREAGKTIQRSSNKHTQVVNIAFMLYNSHVPGIEISGGDRSTITMFAARVEILNQLL